MSQVVHESVQSVFKVGMKLEVVDKMRISQVRVSRMSSRVTNTVTCARCGWRAWWTSRAGGCS